MVEVSKSIKVYAGRVRGEGLPKVNITKGTQSREHYIGALIISAKAHHKSSPNTEK